MELQVSSRIWKNHEKKVFLNYVNLCFLFILYNIQLLYFTFNFFNFYLLFLFNLIIFDSMWFYINISLVFLYIFILSNILFILLLSIYFISFYYSVIYLCMQWSPCCFLFVCSIPYYNCWSSLLSSRKSAAQINSDQLIYWLIGRLIKFHSLLCCYSATTASESEILTRQEHCRVFCWTK